VPDEHESRCDDIKGVQGPDGAGWQLHYVNAVHGIADVRQQDVSPTVRTELFGARCLDQHGQGAHREQHRRDRSRENRHSCHVGDATEDLPQRASGLLPILQNRVMGEFPYAQPRLLAGQKRRTDRRCPIPRLRVNYLDSAPFADSAGSDELMRSARACATPDLRCGKHAGEELSTDVVQPASAPVLSSDEVSPWTTSSSPAP
jgi:hypothetical protein